MIRYIYSLVRDEKKGIIAGFLKLILLLLSFLYAFGTALVRTIYNRGILKAGKLDCRVVSVGNITLGGTGKTPFVKMLAGHLTQKGHKVAILIRGYGRKIKYQKSTLRLRSGLMVSEVEPSNIKNKNLPSGRDSTKGGKRSNPESGNYRSMGDEGCWLAENTDVPVLVGRDRVNTGTEAVSKYNVDVIILDDGFQHWRLKRDLDIVLLDANNPFGNGCILPRGILREPVSSLKRADVLVLSKVDSIDNSSLIGNRLKTINSRALIVECRHRFSALVDLAGNRFDLDRIKGKDVCIFSAIADPSYFEKTVLNLDVRIKLKFDFPDHYNYRQRDLDRILNACNNSGVNTVITTEKDSVKLTSFSLSKAVSVLVLKIELQITQNEQELYDLLAL